MSGFLYQLYLILRKEFVRHRHCPWAQDVIASWRLLGLVEEYGIGEAHFLGMVGRHWRGDVPPKEEPLTHIVSRWEHRLVVGREVLGRVLVGVRRLIWLEIHHQLGLADRDRWLIWQLAAISDDRLILCLVLLPKKPWELSAHILVTCQKRLHYSFRRFTWVGWHVSRSFNDEVLHSWLRCLSIGQSLKTLIISWLNLNL